MPKSVLVADDSLTIRKVIAMIFATEDFQLTLVDNGLDAIAKARELRPDIVLADVLMPGKNGYEVCDALKGDAATANIPVVLLAGTFEAFDPVRAQTVRSNGHITKPFESGVLLDQVKTLLGLPLGPKTAPAYTLASSAPMAAAPPRPLAATPQQPMRPQGLPPPPQGFRPSPMAPPKPSPGIGAMGGSRPLNAVAAPMARPPAQMMPPLPRPPPMQGMPQTRPGMPPPGFQRQGVMPPRAPMPGQIPGRAFPPGAVPQPMYPRGPGAPIPMGMRPQNVSADGGEAVLRDALSRASREVIEKIAWEVVPALAETIIREQLDRLVKDREGKG